MRIHFIETEEKFNDGTTAYVKCGKPVERAYGACMWDFIVMTAPVDLKLIRYGCKDCIKKFKDSGFSGGRNYLYGVVSEQDRALLIQNEEVPA